MATVNFSVPDEVKDAFNRTFAGQNKSAIIAELMRKAVEEAKQQKRREEAFRMLTARRTKRPTATDDEIRAAREEGRP
jgi:metal-responsive CopG/Arc/MetJ family transcriptional regulator